MFTLIDGIKKGHTCLDCSSHSCLLVACVLGTKYMVNESITSTQLRFAILLPGKKYSDHSSLR